MVAYNDLGKVALSALAATGILAIVVIACTDSGSFCLASAAMDMHMTGFKSTWSEDVGCVILFISSWVLNTRAKFFVAFLGIFVLGSISEGLVQVRRELRRKNTSPPWLFTGLYVAHITVGYALMLAAMTFSVELFLAVILGLGTGHHFLNKEQIVTRRADPCCGDADGEGPVTISETSALLGKM